MATCPPAVVVIDDRSSPLGKRCRLRERYALGVLLALRSEATVRHETVIRICEDNIAVGKSILDCLEPAPAPVLAISPRHCRDVETLPRKGRVAEHTGPLHGLDRSVVVPHDSRQSLEQSRVKVMPSLMLGNVLRMAAIASRTNIGMQIPRDSESLAPLDCPQQPVLHEVTDVPSVAILHGPLARGAPGWFSVSGGFRPRHHDTVPPRRGALATQTRRLAPRPVRRSRRETRRYGHRRHRQPVYYPDIVKCCGPGGAQTCRPGERAARPPEPPEPPEPWRARADGASVALPLRQAGERGRHGPDASGRGSNADAPGQRAIRRSASSSALSRPATDELGCGHAQQPTPARFKAACASPPNAMTGRLSTSCRVTVSIESFINARGTDCRRSPLGKKWHACVM